MLSVGLGVECWEVRTLLNVCKDHTCLTGIVLLAVGRAASARAAGAAVAVIAAHFDCVCVCLISVILFLCFGISR